MLEIVFALLSVYFFVVLGFAAKALFKGRIDQESLSLLSLFFLQPILTFWGLSRSPIDASLIYTPLYFLCVCMVTMLFTWLLARMLTDSPKERSLLTVSGILGNTGNLGISLGVAILGPESIPYTSMINVANVLLLYTFGVYFYSRGNFSVRESLINIVKLPVIWCALLAILFNLSQLHLPDEIDSILEMGAYTSIVVQLVIFGMYLASVKVRTVPLGQTVMVSMTKFLLMPMIGVMGLWYLHLPTVAASALFLQLMMPLAVNNINIAALYHCKPKRVTKLTFVTSLIALVVLPVSFVLMKMWV